MGRVTTFAYTVLSQPFRTFNPAISANPLLEQSWTADGLPASLKDANGNATGFAYDRFDRLATSTYPLGSTEALTYDANGNILTRTTRAGDTIAYSYDGLGRLTAKTPPSGPVVSYAYDLASRLTAVSDTSAALAAAVPPGGATTAYTTSFGYDRLNRPTAVTFDPAPAATPPAAGPVVSFAHSYNKANQRTGQTASDSAWIGYPATTPATTAYTANSLNQYTAVGPTTPTYDANGNLTADGTHSFGYDLENRLVSASGAGNTSAYQYDGQGRRNARTVNAAITVSVTDADNREVLEYDGTTGTLLRWYPYALGSNEVIGQIDLGTSNRQTPIPDLLGSIVGAYDSAGALTNYGYQPYGSGNPAPQFGFTGQRIDPETGLYYYRARHYSTAYGRFLQPDPIGYARGMNVYAYGENDPLNLLDPFGFTSDRPSIGRSLIQGTVNLAPGAYYAGLAQQQFRSGNYGWATAYGAASIADATIGSILAIATLGTSAELVATIQASERAAGAFSSGISIKGSLGIFADRQVTVTPKGLGLVTNHLEQFGDFPANTAMLDRLKDAMASGRRITGADAIFYTHEAAEATMMARGLPYETAHAGALEKYGVSSFSVYHPDVIRSLPEHFNMNWYRFWGIE